jgi:DNA-binding CsgD family transcriptional regulator
MDIVPGEAGGRVLFGRREECLVLKRLLDDARSGSSRVLVMRGTAGVGKSALMDFVCESASGLRIANAVGVESEMELPFAGLHQLCQSLLDGLPRLPSPQRVAIETALGLGEGPKPEGLLVGIAVLSLMLDASRQQPLLFLIDDAQWLDGASAQALALAARRLDADSVALVLATRDESQREEFASLPEMPIGGLSDRDSMTLLMSAVKGRLDDDVASRIVVEAKGNPLAILELPRTATPSGLAGGFAVAPVPLSSRLEAGFLDRAKQLPPDTQRLLLLAAADPTGDPALLWRAAAVLGISEEALEPAEEEGLLDVGAIVRFRHPLVRSAVYRASSASRRRAIHAALAEATNAELDPDRQAWHRAQSALGPDDDVADELERSANRAQARGGLGAASAFLRRSVELTSNPVRRIERALSAAQATHSAGAPMAALDLVAIAEAGPLDDLERARAERIRAQIALVEQSTDEAIGLLLAAASRLEKLDPDLAHETYLEAFFAATNSGGSGSIHRVGEAMPEERDPSEQRVAGLLLSGYGRLTRNGFPAGTDLLKRAMVAMRTAPAVDDRDLSLFRFTFRIAASLWDDESMYAIATRLVQLSRELGALTVLPLALDFLGEYLMWAGELGDSAAVFEEGRVLVEALGGPESQPVFADTNLALIALRSEERQADERIEQAWRNADEIGDFGAMLEADWAKAILYNSVGRYAEAFGAAQRYCARHPQKGTGYVFAELIEAATRIGEDEIAKETVELLSNRTQVGGTDFALGAEALARAITAGGATAENLFQEAIERLSRTRMRLFLARGHLVYGEWLRRQQRPLDAREQLQTAHEMFDRMSALAFARRARAELLATGGRAPTSRSHMSIELTAQESVIARLASEGRTNQEIAAQLFLSPYTVDYHLRKVFRKLGINGRGQLDRSLLDRAPRPRQAQTYPRK